MVRFWSWRSDLWDVWLWMNETWRAMVTKFITWIAGVSRAFERSAWWCLRHSPGARKCPETAKEVHFLLQVQVLECWLQGKDLRLSMGAAQPCRCIFYYVNFLPLQNCFTPSFVTLNLLHLFKSCSLLIYPLPVSFRIWSLFARNFLIFIQPSLPATCLGVHGGSCLHSIHRLLREREDSSEKAKDCTSSSSELSHLIFQPFSPSSILLFVPLHLAFLSATRKFQYVPC